MADYATLGRRVAVLFTKAHSRVLAPALGWLDPDLSGDDQVMERMGSVRAARAPSSSVHHDRRQLVVAHHRRVHPQQAIDRSRDRSDSVGGGGGGSVAVAVVAAAAASSTVSTNISS